MYIDIKFIYSILLLCTIAFVGFLIYTLINVNKLLTNVNDILIYNTKSINESLENLPKIVKNIEDATDNTKDITEVATDLVADVVVAKESLLSNAGLAKDVVSIVKNVFNK